jgi:DNA-binding MarR family transcriptional regulator
MTTTAANGPDPRVERPVIDDATELLGLIGEAYRMSRQRIEQVVREHGVTFAQFAILETLTEEPRLSGAELAARSFITPQAAHTALATLTTKGLVEREVEVVHRTRAVRTCLSDAGAQVVTECRRRLVELSRDLAAELSPNQCRTATRVLRRYVSTTQR